MKIICHRGFWTTQLEQNTIEGFKKAFSLGLGIETDIRDHNGEIVIAHDMPVPEKEYLKLEDFLKLCPDNLDIALNVKSDSLADKIPNTVKSKKAFFFDMSIPDMFKYLKQNLPVALRISDIEQDKYESINYPKELISAVWLDSFYKLWYTSDCIRQITDTFRKIFIVSEELHGRNPQSQWQMLKETSNKLDNIYLCTDKPMEALEFFK